MIWRSSSHKRIAQLADGMTTAASFGAAYLAWNLFRNWTGISSPIRTSLYDGWKIAAFSLIWVLLFTKQNAYSNQRFVSLIKEIKIVARTTFFGVAIFFAALFFFRFGYIPRSFILIFAVTNFLFLSLEKAVLIQVARKVRQKGKGRKKAIVVGSGAGAKKFLETLKRNPEWVLEIVGVVAGEKSQAGMKFQGYRIIGTYKEMADILHRHAVDEVIICISSRSFDQIREVFECCEREGVQIRLLSDFFGKIAKKVTVDSVDSLAILSFTMIPDEEWSLYLKRVTDILVSGALLILLAPLFLIIAGLIKLTSRGPVFYRWNVVGFHKKPFRSWKFRTMVPEADDLKPGLESRNIMKGPVFKVKSDPRVTRFGKFLRKYSLDELPQLWSVLKGDMSLVGPRPAGPNELEKYESWQRRKLSIKPGLTCLWQAGGRNKINDFNEWARLDLEYIDHWSIWLDLKIILKTIPSVLRGSGM